MKIKHLLLFSSVLALVITANPSLANAQRSQASEEQVYQNEAFRQVKVTKHSPGNFTVQGQASVTEGTIQYEVLEGTKPVVKSFTRASAGAPAWGDFKIDLKFDQKPKQTYTLNLYEKNQGEGPERLKTLTIPLP